MKSNKRDHLIGPRSGNAVVEGDVAPLEVRKQPLVMEANKMFSPYHFSIESQSDGRKMVARKIGKFTAPPSFFFSLYLLSHNLFLERRGGQRHKKSKNKERKVTRGTSHMHFKGER
jgi:hypothetical protein